MPEIQEYLPQSSVPEGIGGVSQNIEMAGAVGRSLEKFGSDVSEGSMFIHRRQAQQESAQVYSHIADLSSGLSDEVQNGIQNGTLNQEEILKKYDDANEKVQNNLSTSEAQNYLTRLQSRFRGHLMRTMSVGMAQIAKNQAVGGMIDARNKSGNAIFQDPTSFQDYYEAGVEDLDQRIQTGGLPESMRAKATQEMGRDFAKQAIRGWANLDTDKARELLNGDKTKGLDPKFDETKVGDQTYQLLSPDEKFQLNKEIDQRERQNVIEDQRTEKAIKDEQKANSEKWSSDNFSKWVNNGLSTRDVSGAVRDGTLTAEQGEKWVRLIGERQKDVQRPDHALYNSLANRIADPSNPSAINKIEDIMPYVGKGITPQQFNSLNKLFAQTPEEKASSQGEKALFDSAKKTIRFKNMMTQQFDVMGEQKLAQFTADFAAAKQKIRDGGGNVSDLSNPNSKDYFGNSLTKYTTSLQDQMSHLSQDRTDKALGLKPSNSNPEPTPVPDALPPNASPQQMNDWLHRPKKGK